MKQTYKTSSNPLLNANANLTADKIKQENRSLALSILVSTYSYNTTILLIYSDLHDLWKNKVFLNILHLKVNVKHIQLRAKCILP